MSDQMRFSPNHIIKNQSGMSLTGVSIAAGVLAILVMVIAEIFKMSNLSFQQVRMSNDLQTVQNLVQMSLTEPEVCRQALELSGVPLSDYSYAYQNPPVPKVDLTDIKLNGKSLLTTLPGYSIKAKLYSPEAPGTAVNLVDRSDSTLKAFTKYSVIIMLNGIRSDDSAGNVSMRARVPITIVTGPSPATPSKFYDCSSSFQDYKAMCEVLGGEYNAARTPPCLFKKLGMAETFDHRDKLTNNGNATLHLQSPTDEGNNLILSNKEETSYWSLGKRSDTYPSDKAKNLFFSFWNGTVWKQAMNITADGNVGIGTSNPATPLALVGNAYVINGSIGFNRNPDDGSVPPGGFTSKNRYQLSFGTTSGSWFGIETFNTSGVSTGGLYVFGSNGNVGVGTVTPAVKLDVNGNIRPSAAVVGAECSPIGSQAYDGASGAPLYCNGTQWKRSGGTTKEIDVVTNVAMFWQPGGEGPCPGGYTKVGWDGTAHISTCQLKEKITVIVP